eukprot:4818280-Pyramimonas_sp.AAC.2
MKRRCDTTARRNQTIAVVGLSRNCSAGGVLAAFRADQSDEGRGHIPTGRTNRTRGEGSA